MLAAASKADAYGVEIPGFPLTIVPLDLCSWSLSGAQALNVLPGVLAQEIATRSLPGGDLFEEMEPGCAVDV